MTRRTALLALALLAPAKLAAQAPDPVIQKIWAIGMDSSWTPKLAQALFRLHWPAAHRYRAPEERERLAGEELLGVGHSGEERAVRHVARMAARVFAH